MIALAQLHVRLEALCLCAMAVSIGCGGDGPDAAYPGIEERPTVIATHPEDGSTDVDPDLEELRATFDRTMRDGSWSWAYMVEDRFPEIVGDPYYADEARTTNVLPVRLERGRTYEVWINSATFQNFQDEQGRPAKPFALTFTTRP
ncbi:MAG: Ig-like domain-containing protein [Myxococcales bacterium]|nr:Ig-like domain-containing protein [Myxococcales bacterium]MDD9970847.1 Ig-like domain-containing protein [Myxococcales bacterium]